MSAWAALGARSAVAADHACPIAGAEHVGIAAVDARLQMITQAGRVLRLAGFAPVQPTPDAPDLAAAARAALSRALGGRVALIELAKPDRWGRIPVFAFLPGAAGGPARSLAAWMLSQGYGRYMPDYGTQACRALFLASESAARAARRGLWHDPYYAIVAATDTAVFAQKAATNVIVEGRVVSLDVRPKRIYLLFGPRGSGGFAVTILQRGVKIFERAGLSVRALIGRRIRVRGLLDLRFGPQIEVATPDAVEIMPEPGAVSGSGGSVEAKAAAGLAAKAQ